jgi:hypothetical protein
VNSKVAKEIYYSWVNANITFVFFRSIFYIFISAATFIVYKRDIINRGILKIGILRLNILRRKFKYSVRACL